MISFRAKEMKIGILKRILKQFIPPIFLKIYDFVKPNILSSNRFINEPTRDEYLSHRMLLKKIGEIPIWSDKIDFLDRFIYSNESRKWVAKSLGLGQDVNDTNKYSACINFDKIQYGCGENLKDNWLNVDAYKSSEKNYLCVDLLENHPFASGSFKFAYSEDVIEHFNQSESIFFLSEVFRTLSDGGILRVSFPGLEGVLARHYTPINDERLKRGELEAYSIWDHVHFYSREELELVSRHIGFKKIDFVSFGKSKFPELSDCDTRLEQADLNTIAELTK